ncbi:hypothetical protein FF38_09494 [Lucilia cuprina]|uniref:DNA/RNA non-specific endonuclease domain-containing protein n=1 Tax=Lucilia cuprina TaxID=7375 RepID=A0A0L0BR90_LUCCU|nr:hypothetical protein CVS40_4688 [Lucilia cuprina]KNC22552.1 hypothetical protein FF38_09494 [Lucilia cuprina]
MFLKFNKLFLNIIFTILCFINTISIAIGECVINFNQNPTFKPTILLKIGSHSVDLPLKDVDTDLTLFENQEIEALCPTTFEYPERYDTERKLNIKCEHNYLYLQNSYGGYQTYSSSINLKCSSIKWNLYETFNNFVWCPSNVTSYLLARPTESLTSNYQYLAGICYDIRNLSFKSLYYTITPKHSESLHPNLLSTLYEPSLELKYIKETFPLKSVTETEYDSQDVQDWINYSKYNYGSIVHNSILNDELNHELGSILDLAWWPNLRLGNWKRYENALTKHVERQQQAYDILSGVSGVATVPIIKTCESNFTLKELIDNRNRIIPMYVWNYLRSTSNSSDEIVIIGFNSPFYEFYSEMDVIFCTDKCQEIPWLNKVSTTFRYSAMGVIFCCSVDDVKASQRLDGFPVNGLDTAPEKIIHNISIDATTALPEYNNYD